MGSSLLDRSSVFCLSANAVIEGHHFLTLVPLQSTVKSCIKKPPRCRTLSLPPSLDGIDSKSSKLRRSWRSFSVDISKRTEDECSNYITKLEVIRRCQTSIKSKVSRGKKKSTKEKRATVMKSSNQSTAQRTQLCSACPATLFWMDGYLLSYFIGELRRSQVFRSLIINRFSVLSSSGREVYPLLVFVVVVEHTKQHALDLLGNKMVNSNILHRRSLEHALSWLSTLGGAFSALGDLSPTWAEEAGHVSITQLRIAMKLGDPGIQSRCRLYAAISLLQRGYLKSCRDIVKSEYQYAKSIAESDPRLRRMCLGVWSKLQYHWTLVASTNKQMLKLSLMDGLNDISSNKKYRIVYDLEEGRKIARA